MKLRYQQVPLLEATKVARAHVDSIPLPGMVLADDVYLSRSDHAISMRPDLSLISEQLASPATDIQATREDIQDWLSHAYYVAEWGAYIYFCRFYPQLETKTLYSTEVTGKITTDGVNRQVVGIGTQFYDKVWPGCLIRTQGSDDLYLIDSVLNDELLMTEKAMPQVTSSDYEILRIHHPDTVWYPIRTAQLGNNLVYDGVKPVASGSTKLLCGPFYAQVVPQSVGVWDPLNPDPGEIDFDILALGMSQRYDLGAYVIDLAKIVIGNLGQGYDCVDPTAGVWDPVKSGVTENLTAICSGTAWYGPWTAVTSGGDILARFYQRINESGLFWPTFQYAWVPSAGYELVWYRDINGNYNVTSYALYGIDLASGLTNADNAAYLVCGDGGTLIMTRLDTSVQTALTSGVATALRGIARKTINTDRAVVVGDAESAAGLIIGCTDVTSWTRYGTGPAVTTEDLRAVCWAPELDMWAIVGTAGEIVTGAEDFSSWTAQTSGVSEQLNGVAKDGYGHLLCAVGENGAIVVSLDGTNWEEVTGETADWNAVQWWDHGGMWVMGGDDGAVLGLRPWVVYDEPTAETGTIAAAIHDVVFDGTYFIAVGDGGVWTSTDGINWTQRLTAAVVLNAVEANGSSYYVAVGDGGVIYQTTDPTGTWNSESSPTSANLYSLKRVGGDAWWAAGAGGVIIAGDETDGTTWVEDNESEMYAVASYYTVEANENDPSAYRSRYFMGAYSSIVWNRTISSPADPDDMLQLVFSGSIATGLSIDFDLYPSGFVYAASLYDMPGTGYHAYLTVATPEGIFLIKDAEQHTEPDAFTWACPNAWNVDQESGVLPVGHHGLRRTYTCNHVPEMLMVCGDSNGVRFGVSLDLGRTWSSTHELTEIDDANAVADYKSVGSLSPLTAVHDGTNWWIMVGRNAMSYFYKLENRTLKTEKVTL